MANYPYNELFPYNEENGKMKLNGVGTVKVMPDMATVNIGIITENQSLKAAQEENSLKSNAVIGLLREMSIPDKQIRTSTYNIETIYDYIEGKQVFKGYRVTNLLSVTIKNLDELGAVIDNSTLRGANRIDSISFMVSNPTLYYNRALELAVKDTLKKASSLSMSIGLILNEKPLSITEEGPPPTVYEAPMYKFAAQPTPILPGQIDITARIEAIFEYKLY